MRMNDKMYKRLYLGEFKPDNGYEANLKRIKRMSSSEIAEELTHLYGVVDRLTGGGKK